jgi:hypothetical protein
MKAIQLFLFLVSGLAFTQPEHDLWSEVLQSYVSEDGRVNYKALKDNPVGLNTYLSDLEREPPKDNWTKEEVLSYWINAYNAYTVKLILDFYPVNSIKDIKRPWSREFIPHEDRSISLNYIEHQILRNLGEPRIHFAIVCASVSCPILRNEAYIPEQIDKQLHAATRTFLNDSSKNTFGTNRAEISKIFKWFSKDFKTSGGVLNFIKAYKSTGITKSSQLYYKNYSWDLNE